MWRKKKFLIPAAALIVVLIGGGVWVSLSWGGAKNPTAKPTLAQVTRGDIRLAVACTGRVASNLDVDIKCKASGEIVKLPFDISDKVKKDDLLMELDPVDEQRNFRLAEVGLSASQAKLIVAQQNLAIAESTLATDRKRAEATLQSAQVSAADARAKADRMKQLLAKQLSSQEETDTAETTAAQAESALTAAEVAMDVLTTEEQALELKRQDVVLAQTQVESDTIAKTQTEDRLHDTKVVAPMDGVVVARDVQIGQIIASAVSNVGGGTTILTLSDLSHIFVLASVDESEIGKVAEDQQATITADAYPGKRFTGKVVRIATRGVNSSNVVTFEVKIEVISENRDLLKPEMTTNVEIVAAEKNDVLTVPADAVLRKGRKQTATVVKGGKNEDRTVEVGITDSTNTEIISGLTEGETVVVHKGAADSRWNAGQQRPQGGNRPPSIMGGGPGGGGGRR
jgi:HlyD family secretion protein